MPMTHTPRAVETLRRLVVATLAYAVAISLVVLSLPTVLTPLPVAALLREPQPVVSRIPVGSPASEHRS